MSSDYPKGSLWRKWDLQIQTIIDDSYVSIDSYADELKAAEPDKWQQLCDKIGSEDLVKKYDSRSYFYTDTTDDEKLRAKNYARVFTAFLDIFHDDEVVVCVTDHNYSHPYLIDALLKESKGTKVGIIPGVEINVTGVHMLVLFNGTLYGKPTYSEGIKEFLSQIDVHNPMKDGALTVSSKSYQSVIDEIKKLKAVLIYPHCNSSNGLFQERGKTDRTHLADHYNYQTFNILQSKTKDSADAVSTNLLTRPALTSGHVFTLGTDSRCLRDILQPDDKGNYCWIKADPTFEGLKQICYEPEGRVFIGTEPALFGKVAANQTKFIDHLKVGQVNGYDESRGVWFKDIDIPFNSELVAIIGNKGSGKSAIADILGLLGESKNIEAASFLNSTRFKKSGLAKNFEAEITWASGDTDKKNLFDNVDPTSVEKVKYLPQRWFEELCNDLDGKQFSKELEKVVYTHLDESEKLGNESFEDLIELKSTSVGEDLQELKGALHAINVEAAALIQKLHPDHTKELEASLAQKRRELEAHSKTEPEKVENPDKTAEAGEQTGGVMAQVQRLDADITSLSAQILQSRTEQGNLRRKSENLKTFEDDIARAKRSTALLIENQKVKELFGDNTANLIQIIVDEGAINRVRSELSAALTTEKNKCLSEADIKALGLDSAQEEALLSQSLQVTLSSKYAQRDELKKQLQKPQEEYQKYLEAHSKWKRIKASIEGATTDPDKDTINYYVAELQKIKGTYVTDLANLKLQQTEKSKEIFEKKNEIVQIYSTVKAKVDSVIAQNKPNIEDYSINIEAGFTLTNNFKDELSRRINLRAKGSFMVKESAYRLLSTILDDKDFDKLDDLVAVQDAILQNLETDARSEVKDDDKPRQIPDQIPDIVDFYDYLYGLDFLTENYQLRLDNKNLESLSPGEKGALLLVFYLMLDQDDIPLVIDQPEDNLDNQSVARILVKFINGAKKRRQIILVTHNPNLAVVADAEQIIYTQFDKTSNKNVFAESSGSIEDDEINKHIVDVLEGTMPAFDKRRLRYLKKGDS